MTRVISFANMKGGVGKTTLCVNLAFEIFNLGYKVLVVDNDPQFNATSALMRPEAYIKMCIKDSSIFTIYDIYEKPPRVHGSKKEKKDPKKFFYSSWYMVKDPDVSLDLIPSRIELYETLRNPAQKEYVLNNFLKKHASKYDYIFIDCPPTPSVLNLSGFAASNYVIIPVKPDYYSTMGLPQFLSTLYDFKSDCQDPNDVIPLGVIFTDVERQPSTNTLKSISRVEATLEEFGNNIHIFNTKMSHFKVYENTVWQSVPVQKITGRGIRGKGLAVAQLKNIAQELISKITSLEEN